MGRSKAKLLLMSLKNFRMEDFLLLCSVEIMCFKLALEPILVLFQFVIDSGDKCFDSPDGNRSELESSSCISKLRRFWSPSFL